jgi:hypothetical protein
MCTLKWVSVLLKLLSETFGTTDAKFYQNQTKAHPPDGMIKPYVFRSLTMLLSVSFSSLSV